VAWAQARVDEVGEQLVNDFIDNVITLQGRFEQSLIDADGIVQERSSGTLEIERPGRFRWSYFEPLNIWSYDVDLAQVTVKPQAKALANTPALLLRPGCA
jgi:outer membrane lipoprotein carrier protein